VRSKSYLLKMMLNDLASRIRDIHTQMFDNSSQARSWLMTF